MSEQQTGLPIAGLEALMLEMSPEFIAGTSGTELTGAIEHNEHVVLQVPYGVRDGERLGSILPVFKKDDEPAGSPEPSKSDRKSSIGGRITTDSIWDD